MIFAKLPANELERLNKLLSYNILDTPAEEDYNDIVQLASQICEVPMSFISLLETRRQWIKAQIGVQLDENISRELAFCSHTILQEDILEVEDTAKDMRFFDHPSVINEPSIKFYAGIPIRTIDGFSLGTLCVMGQETKKLTKQQRFALLVLAKQVMILIESRLSLTTLNKNIGELREKNEEITRLNQEVTLKSIKLDELNKTKDKLFSIIGHDLRSPITSLMSFLDLLADNEKISVDEFRTFIPVFQKNLTNVQEILENLLKWSQTQMGGLKTFPQETDLQRIITKKINLFEKIAHDKEISLKHNLTSSLMVWADSDHISLIIHNLLSNAIKFTPTKGEINITVKDIDKTKIEVAVSDTGVGMSKEQQEKLFNNTTSFTTYGTNGEKGTGLGLLLCKEFVEKNGGKIWLESELGKGTTFKFTVPKKI